MDTTIYEHAEDMRCIAEFALENDCLEGAALGIAKQITSLGWDTLTPRQQEVFEAVALPATRRECWRCGNEIIATELCFGGEVCGWCDHQLAKDD
jgi:hypothetical protein